MEAWESGEPPAGDAGLRVSLKYAVQLVERSRAALVEDAEDLSAVGGAQDDEGPVEIDRCAHTHGGIHVSGPAKTHGEIGNNGCRQLDAGDSHGGQVPVGANDKPEGSAGHSFTGTATSVQTNRGMSPAPPSRRTIHSTPRIRYASPSTISLPSMCGSRRSRVRDFDQRFRSVTSPRQPAPSA
jgi:hypothetical protein